MFSSRICALVSGCRIRWNRPAVGDGADVVECQRIAAGLALGNAQRLDGDVPIAQLAKRRGGAQHAFERALALGAQEGAQVGLARLALGIAAEAAGLAQPKGSVADLDQPLPLTAPDGRQPCLAPPGQRGGEVAVQQGLVGSRQRRRPGPGGDGPRRVGHQHLDGDQGQDQKGQQDYAGENYGHVPASHHVARETQSRYQDRTV